jgi:hypothetical protein
MAKETIWVLMKDGMSDFFDALRNYGSIVVFSTEDRAIKYRDIFIGDDRRHSYRTMKVEIEYEK